MLCHACLHSFYQCRVRVRLRHVVGQTLGSEDATKWIRKLCSRLARYNTWFHSRLQTSFIGSKMPPLILSMPCACQTQTCGGANSSIGRCHEMNQKTMRLVGKLQHLILFLAVINIHLIHSAYNNQTINGTSFHLLTTLLIGMVLFWRALFNCFWLEPPC